ncbi:MAG TPA: Holliday junction branch migration protein RuvA [Elusimicrobia bacterium]|jgi:Holliday junction DNA helicase RuvA|nr:Holliday junction branch migration protein RuvA [Elusimicrobiota bacterium]
MYNFLEGTLADKSREEVTLAVNGIGYQIFVPLTTYEKLPKINQPLKLYTYFHVRENIQQIYGFFTREERQLFGYLLDVPDVGPKIALSVVSHCPPVRFKKTVSSKEISYLTTIPGIGKKTAEKIILELKEKIKEWIISEEKGEIATEEKEILDAIAGLVALGYREFQAREAVEEVLSAASSQQKSKLSAEDLVTQALKKFNR